MDSTQHYSCITCYTIILPDEAVRSSVILHRLTPGLSHMDNSSKVLWVNFVKGVWCKYLYIFFLKPSLSSKHSSHIFIRQIVKQGDHEFGDICLSACLFARPSVCPLMLLGGLCISACRGIGSAFNFTCIFFILR